MKNITQMNLDVYIFIKEFIEEKNYSPSYTDILNGTNYKSRSSVKDSIEKLMEYGLISGARQEDGTIISRTIKIIDTKENQEKLKKIRNKLNG